MLRVTLAALSLVALAPAAACAQGEAAPTEAAEVAESTEPGGEPAEPVEPGEVDRPVSVEPVEDADDEREDDDDELEEATDAEGRDRGDPEDVVGTIGGAIEELGASLEVQPETRVRWDPSWPRYRFDELVLTVGAGLVILFEELLPTRTDANWTGVSDFDLEVSRGLALGNATDRDMVEEISNGIVVGLVAWPVLFDSILYAGAGEGSWDVAWQLSLIALEVFALNHVLTVMVRLLARRERPVGRFCREDPTGYADPVCDDQPPAESFWSPQVSNAFAGAALVCSFHDALDLFGETWSDGIACGTAVAAAATTGLLRIMSDSNWITDVLSGAVVGTAIGALVPWILHFQGGARPPLSGDDAPAITVLPMMDRDTLGVSVMGMM